MPRLHADADASRWVAITGSLGLRGRRHRKAAIRMLMSQAGSVLGGSTLGGPALGSSATGTAAPRGRGRGLASWALSQAVPLLMRRADGRVLAWVWKADPELLVVMAQIQQLTPQLRTARAMMPMEYDDTQSFTGALGAGEKLVMPLPPTPQTPPFATYTWDTGTHLVTVTAVCSDRERFGTVLPAVDDLARTIRIVDDVAVNGGANTLRIEPS